MKLNFVNYFNVKNIRLRYFMQNIENNVFVVQCSGTKTTIHNQYTATTQGKYSNIRKIRFPDQKPNARIQIRSTACKHGQHYEVIA